MHPFAELCYHLLPLHYHLNCIIFIFTNKFSLYFKLNIIALLTFKEFKINFALKKVKGGELTFKAVACDYSVSIGTLYSCLYNAKSL